MKWPRHEKFDLERRTILLGYMGSHSHGTHIMPVDGGIDDIDVMGACVPPVNEYFLGYQEFAQVDEWVDEYDIIIYNIRKFIKLLLRNNPNVLGLLWLRPEDYIQVSSEGRQLIDNRDMFSSKLAYHSFTGYARDQLKRMTHFKFEGYMGEKRKALVEKYGYDVKNAAHLIRILRMGTEFIETSQLNVFRTDAEAIKDIKRGKYKLSEIKEMAEDLFIRAEAAFKACDLPEKPDMQMAEELLINIIHSTERRIRIIDSWDFNPLSF